MFHILVVEDDNELETYSVPFLKKRLYMHTGTKRKRSIGFAGCRICGPYNN